MKTFLKFLEQEGLKDVLYDVFYKELLCNRYYVPKNKQELRRLAYRFGKEKIVWWLMFSSDVSEYAKLDGKALSKKQLLVISAYLGVMSWLLGIYFLPGFLAASIYLESPLWQELVKFFFEKKVKEYVSCTVPEYDGMD